jgi:hypothetical protein
MGVIGWDDASQSAASVRPLNEQRPRSHGVGSVAHGGRSLPAVTSRAFFAPLSLFGKCPIRTIVFFCARLRRIRRD